MFTHTASNFSVASDFRAAASVLASKGVAVDMPNEFTLVTTADITEIHAIVRDLVGTPDSNGMFDDSAYFAAQRETCKTYGF